MYGCSAQCEIITSYDIMTLQPMGFNVFCPGKAGVDSMHLSATLPVDVDYQSPIFAYETVLANGIIVYLIVRISTVIHSSTRHAYSSSQRLILSYAIGTNSQ